jgi:hypothetical protein
MRPEFLFRMALIDIDSAVTGVDAFLAGLQVLVVA